MFMQNFGGGFFSENGYLEYLERQTSVTLRYIERRGKIY